MSEVVRSSRADVRSWWRLLPILAILAALIPMTAQSAEAVPPRAQYCAGGWRHGVDHFLSHAEVRASLNRIERNSQGRVDVNVAGHTNRGRELFTARVGHGDQVVLVQSQIHGNEMHGTVALMRFLERLGDNSARSAQIRDAVTVVAIPQLNADGGALNQRQNDMPWDDVVRRHPQLAGAPRAWYYSNNAGGFDTNRDFNPDLTYRPRAEDLPGNSNGVGFYITPEAQTVSGVYADLEAEFGKVHYFLDLHGQAACYRNGTPAQRPERNMTYLSISGKVINESWWEDWPLHDYDASRRANLAIHDALQFGGSHYLSEISLYPQNTHIPGTALGSFALRGSAIVLFETSGQTQQIGSHRLPMLVHQIDVGMMGLIDSITDGEIDNLDPERYETIPHRSSWSSGR